MEIIKYNLTKNLDLPKNFTDLYNQMNFAIFDIETTGLSPNFHKVILIGLLYIENNKIVIEQFFCNNKKEECQLLNSFKEKIQQFDLLINYNGNTFDIPFLNKRFLANKIDYSMESYKSIDLLRLVKKVQNTLALESFKLKSIEKYLGIHRNDTISGQESVLLYNEFEKKQNKQLKDLILLHNYDDLYYLGRSLKILDQVSYEDIIHCFPQAFYIGKKEIAYITRQITKNGSLNLEGIYKSEHIDDYVVYENGYSFEYTKSSNIFKAKIPLYKGLLSSGTKCLYIDTNDFPFSYAKKSTNNHIPDNIILLKDTTKIHILEIYSFVFTLISYVLKNIEKNQS